MPKKPNRRSQRKTSARPPTGKAVSTRVDANPEKRFFIDMLIKDIELIPSIVDLVDNSVDAARASRRSASLSGLTVKITANENGFSIIDNCRGIEVEVATKYAFRFGRPRDFHTQKGSVGQFGIGMKRSLFKLGDHFTIRSVAPKSSFVLEVDVPEWEAVNDPDWNFQLAEVKTGISNPVAQRGTHIEVTQLHEAVRDDFQRDEIIRAIRKQIAMKHEPALRDDLLIEVNGRPVEAHEPVLLSSRDIVPINIDYTLEVGDNGEIDVQIIAGIAPSKERALKDEGDATEFKEPDDAGWYVYCNDRMIIAADTTPMTGWGSAAAAYHPQYRRFRGYVFMRADDPSLLPWNTTKTALDQDSDVFRQVQQEMFRVLPMVQSIINRAKMERQLVPSDDQVINRAINDAPEKKVTSLRRSRTFIAPDLPPRTPTPSNVVNVQYRVQRSEMNRVMRALRTSSASKAGQMTFQYFVDAELRG